MVTVLAGAMLGGILGEAIRAGEAGGGSRLVGIGLLAGWTVMAVAGIYVQYRRAVRIAVALAQAQAQAQGQAPTQVIIIRDRRR